MFDTLTPQPLIAGCMAQPGVNGALSTFIPRQGSHGPGHHDAVHGARRQAQLAADAFGGDHGVHEPRGSDNGIHRAGLDAQRAADAAFFVYDCNERHDDWAGNHKKSVNRDS